MAALFLPILLVVLFIASPLEWVELVTFDELQRLVRHPLMRLGLFGFVFLCFFHWAHRFRYLLADLGMHGLKTPVAVLCYGFALFASVMGVLEVLQVV